jgi:hypothetical protein
MPRGYPKNRPGASHFAASLHTGARAADNVLSSVAAQLKARLAVIEDEATHIRRALAGLGVGSNGTRPKVAAAPAAPPAPKKVKRRVTPAALAAMRANAEKARLAKQAANQGNAFKGRKLPENAIPLSKMVTEILSPGTPLSTAEIADQVLARGYLTTSPNFRTVVQAGMKKLPVRRDAEGKWTLAVESRSVQKRKAVQQGRPAPLFAKETPAP